MILLPHLETDVTQACQLSCVACNHAVPLWRKHGPWTATPEQVEEDLTALARVAHANAWAALGGEPLLNKHLGDICWVARRTGIADSYGVWTNGVAFRSRVARAGGTDFLGHIDALVLSRYPGKLTDDDVTYMRAVCHNHGVELIVRDEIREPNFMTWLEKEPTNGPDTRRKYSMCAFRRGHNYAASYGYFFACCCGPHLPLLVQGRAFGDDGLALRSITEQGLRAYLDAPEPFGACAICAGRDTAVKIPWREERDPVIWLSKSAGKDGVTR